MQRDSIEHFYKAGTWILYTQLHLVTTILTGESRKTQKGSFTWLGDTK
jgi:hypothetical protein